MIEIPDIPEPPKFKETREKDVLNIPLPPHIPDRCPECRTSMNRKVNLYPTRSRFAFLLRGIAPWLSIIVFISLMTFMFFAPAGIVSSGGLGSGMAFVAMIITPPIVLTLLANCIPKVLKLQCHRCPFNKDYPKAPKDKSQENINV